MVSKELPQNTSAPLSEFSIGPTKENAHSITWSKNGFIAYMAPTHNSKYNLFLTYLENIDGRTWQLAKPQGLSMRPNDDCELPHLSSISWSNLSTDLAVCDDHGNFYILLAGVGLLGQNGEGKPTENGSGIGNINENSTEKNSPSSNGNFPSYELTSYNHTEMIYRDIISPNLTGSSVTRSKFVAFKWLNIEKTQIINKPAAFVNTDPQQSQQQPQAPLAYSYGVTQYQPYGACHPISTKQACVALRQNGEFILYFQGEHKVEYHKVSVPVLNKKIVSFTRASIGFDSKRIIATAYDSILDTIFSFLVDIEWGFLIESSKKQKVDPHYYTPKELQTPPKLNLRVFHQMRPRPLLEIEVQSVKNEDAMDIDDNDKNNDETRRTLSSLSSIDIISTNFEQENQLMVFISYESLDEITQQKLTTIYRYSITKALDLISSAFVDLGLRKNISKPNGAITYELSLQDKLTRPDSIQSIDTAVAETFIIITYEDGQIDLMDRKTLSLVSNNQENKNTTPPTITTLFDVGFQFPKIERTSKNPLRVSVSPNLTSLVYTEVNNETQQLTLKVLEKRPECEISPKELFITSVGFAFRHAYSCYTNTCADDLVALIQTEIKRIGNSLAKAVATKESNLELILNRFIESIICESHKAINFQLDAFGKDSVDKLLSNPPLQKLLSLQLVLGELQQNSNHVISDLAWIVLNLRSTSFGIMFSLSSIYRQISKKKPAEDSLQDSITRAECIMSLVGNVKWLIDLMIYLNQELLQLAFVKNTNSTDTKLHYKNSIVLPIILSKVPRLFLMYAWSSIGKTHEILKKLHKDLSESNKLFTPMKEALNRYFTVCNTSPLNLSISENFLRECDAYVSKEIASRAANKDRGYALKIEQKLVCQGELSDDLVQIAKLLIERHSINISRDIKVSELFFYDVNWIDVGITKNTMSGIENEDFFRSKNPVIHIDPKDQRTTIPRLQYNRIECIDALRKVVVKVGDKLNPNLATVIPKKNNNNKLAKLRKCTRCRSVSSVTDPLVFDVPSNVGLWTMVFQRTCICGSAWVNCEK